MILFRKNWLFLLFTILILLVLQNTPYIYHRLQTPKDRVYLGAERYPPDYYIYLFYTGQGALNKTLVTDYYTNEPHEDSVVHYEYLIAGKIGSILGLSLPATFYIFRSLTFLFFFLLSFFFLSIFLKNTLWLKFTFLLSLFWSGIPWLQFNNWFNLTSYIDFYQPPDLTNRLMYEPHKFLGMSLFLICFYLISSLNAIRYPLYAKYFALTALLLLTGIIHGVSSISLIFTILLYLCFRFLIHHMNKKSVLSFISSNIKYLGYLLVLALPLLYWKIVFTNNPVWFQVFNALEGYFVNLDKNAPLLPTIQGYLLILGPLIILSIVGFKKFLSENKNSGLLLLSFLLSNLLLFFIVYVFLGTSKQRYFQTPYLLGWSIMAVYGMQKILGFLKRRIININVIVFIIFITVIILGLPNFKQGLDRELNQFGTPPNLSLLAYPTKNWYESLVWLKNNSTKESVILALPSTSLIIPAFPGRLVLAGDYVHSFKYNEKLPMVEKFFSGNLTQDEAQAFLKKEKVNYVFVGDEEKSKGEISSYQTLLTLVFSNSDVTIYQVK